MSSTSRSQHSATIIAFPVRQRAAAVPQPSQQDDLEERRWQLEWERRNVQD
jgi:hypothetical protein